MPNTDRDHPVLVPNEPQNGQDPAPKPVETENKLGMSMLMKIALGVLVLSSLVISISCLMKANQLQRQTTEMKAEITDYNERIKKLKYYINEEVDDEYIAKFAREMLDMYFPDEDVYYNDAND